MNALAFMLDTARTRSTFQFTWKLGKALAISSIRRWHENPVGPRQSLVNSIAKVLGIDKPAERCKKPEIPEKGQRCYLYMAEIARQPDYTLNKNKLNSKVKTVCIYC